MTSYSVLTGTKATEGSIRSWVNDSTVPSTVILTQAEAWIYTRLRVGQMLKFLTGQSIALDATSVPVQSDYLTPMEFRVTTPEQREVVSVEPERLMGMITYDISGNRISGPPSCFARIGTNLEFEVKSDKAYTYSLLYYAQPAALSASNETNFITDRYPQMLYWACQGFAYDFRKDPERKMEAFSRAEVEIAHCNGDWDRERHDSQGGIYALNV